MLGHWNPPQPLPPPGGLFWPTHVTQAGSSVPQASSCFAQDRLLTLSPRKGAEPACSSLHLLPAGVHLSPVPGGWGGHRIPPPSTPLLHAPGKPGGKGEI